MECMSKMDLADVLFRMAKLKETSPKEYAAVLGVIDDLADLLLGKANKVVELIEKVMG